MNKLFIPADILIPQKKYLTKWSCVACDQYTSEPEYWDRVTQNTKGVPSARHIIFPEAYLSGNNDEGINAANEQMKKYLSEGIFDTYLSSFIYVTRTLSNGLIRHGIVGAVDLMQYNWRTGSKSPVRATEKTVAERIPPRVRLRENAPLEIPHILLLCSDFENRLSDYLNNHEYKTVYDFDLMENGGHINGKLIDGKEAEELTELLSEITTGDIGIAVGDGNHSLASALACFEKVREQIGEEKALTHPSRWALAELVNIADSGIVFEPIHRIAQCNVSELISFIQNKHYSFGQVPYYHNGEKGVVFVSPDNNTLPCAGLQSLLDEFAQSENSLNLDYIHGDDTLIKLASQPGSIGFILPAFPKNKLFPTVSSLGSLPRKAFSMGNAQDKRFYLETRRISRDTF